MNRFNAIIRLGSCLGLFVASPAFGAGFQINEQAARATGRGNAVIATISDASAIWHNPAGLTRTSTTEFMAGVSIIFPDNDYTGPGFQSTNPNFPSDGSDTLNSSASPVPHAYVSRKLSDRAFIGLGFHPSYGLATRWQDPKDWLGRTQNEEIALTTYFLVPTVALKVTDEISLAVGLQLVPASVELRQTLGEDNGEVLFPRDAGESTDGRLDVFGTAFGVGATAGLTVELIDHQLALGIVYRSAVDLNFEGDADFTLPASTPVSVRQQFPDQTGDASLTVPHTLGFGIGWVQEKWDIEFATQITFWNSYEELRLNFSTGLPAPFTAEPRDWNIVPMFRLGGEYRLNAFSFRLGAVFDMTPAPDETVGPDLPDGNRFNVAGGIGYDFGPVRIDAAYLAVILSGRTLDDTSVFPLRGEFEGGVIHVPALTLGVKI